MHIVSSPSSSTPADRKCTPHLTNLSPIASLIIENKNQEISKPSARLKLWSTLEWIDTFHSSTTQCRPLGTLNTNTWALFATPIVTSTAHTSVSVTWLNNNPYSKQGLLFTRRNSPINLSQQNKLDRTCGVALLLILRMFHCGSKLKKQNNWSWTYELPTVKLQRESQLWAGR